MAVGGGAALVFGEQIGARVLPRVLRSSSIQGKSVLKPLTLAVASSIAGMYVRLTPELRGVC